MHWLLTTHARRYNLAHHLTGHVWQGRFKAFAIQEDGHLLTVLRYVERNPVRANLTTRAADWRWSSLTERLVPPSSPFLAPSPVALPATWASEVEAAHTEAELASLQRSVQRGCPFGDPAWAKLTALRYGLEHTLRPRGRPPKKNSEHIMPDQPSLFSNQ
jgi:putative transposase